MVGRDVAADLLEAGGIKAGERDGEAGPDFLLKLGEHGFDRNHQDAPAPTAFDEFGEKDSALDGFSEPDGVRNEEALPGLGEGKERGVELVGEHVHGSPVTEVEDAVLRGGGADVGFQHEAGFGIVRTGVPDGLGISGIDDGDFTGFALNGVNKLGFLAFDQGGQPDDSQNCGPGGGAVDPPDKPFLVAD